MKGCLKRNLVNCRKDFDLHLESTRTANLADQRLPHLAARAPSGSLKLYQCMHQTAPSPSKKLGQYHSFFLFAKTRSGFRVRHHNLSFLYKAQGFERPSMSALFSVPGHFHKLAQAPQRVKSEGLKLR